MNRVQLKELLKWKDSPRRKPLIIRGARQVGKTWLMKEFGSSAYEKIAYVNFESNKQLKDLFKDDFDIQRILLAIQIETGIAIEPNNTLIIFDEIQEAPGALTSLKYFQENAPSYHIVSAGSLLGVALAQSTSFPVGKVEFMDLYPLSYLEFLDALGESPLKSLLESADWKMINAFKTKYIQLLKQYYYIGGMPEAVNSFRNNRDMEEVRTIQQQILISYEQDFSKHAPVEIVPRIRMLWNGILAQLAKENKKFIYGALRQGARSKDYELALSWLIDCGLIHKINRVNKPGIPLKAYIDNDAFKLFIVDIGLLGAMGNLDVKTILVGNSIFEEFKGALTEQYVLQQLLQTRDMAINYWSAASATAEIDFLIQYAGQVVPIEVKAAENLQAKSLRSFNDKYLPKISVRTSMSDYREEDWLVNIPLYGISELGQMLAQKD